jgi:hypothetical protein
MKKPFLSDLSLLNERLVLLVSSLAITSKFYVERDVIFAYGDACAKTII